MQDESSLKFSERLSRSMDRAGIKQARLAEMTGFSKGYVSGLLSGAKVNPSQDTVKKFSEVLQVSAEWLATGNVSVPGEPPKKRDQSLQKAEEATYRIREPHQPTLMERMEEYSRKITETQAQVAEVKGMLSALMDLLARPTSEKDEPPTSND